MDTANVNVQGNVIGWDDDLEVATGNSILEPGYARFDITEMKRSRFDGSAKIEAGPMAVLKLNVVDANGTRATVESKIILNTKLLWKVTELAKAVGFLDEDAPDGSPFKMAWTELEGKSGYCLVKHRVWTDNDGNDHTFNEIGRFLSGREAEKASCDLAGDIAE